MDKSQIDILADFIMATFEGEPSKSEGAGDTAIRIIKNLRSENEQYLEELSAEEGIASRLHKRFTMRDAEIDKLQVENEKVKNQNRCRSDVLRGHAENFAQLTEALNNIQGISGGTYRINTTKKCMAAVLQSINEYTEQVLKGGRCKNGK